METRKTAEPGRRNDTHHHACSLVRHSGGGAQAGMGAHDARAERPRDGEAQLELAPRANETH